MSKKERDTPSEMKVLISSTKVVQQHKSLQNIAMMKYNGSDVRKRNSNFDLQQVLIPSSSDNIRPNTWNAKQVMRPTRI